MNETPLEIERIVREVLASMQPAPAATAEKRPATAVAGELAIDAAVVTMNEIIGRLDGVRRVTVSRGSLVTPAVRDELLRRNIALERATPDAACGRTAVRLAMVVSGTDFDPASLAAALGREGLCVEATASDCLIAATDRLAAELAQPGTLGVLLTKHAAAAICLANRLAGVRAIGVCDARQMAATAASVGANVLAADPRSVGFFPLKQTIAEFARGGVRPCPEVFRERLK